MAAKPETNFYTAVHALLPESMHHEKMNNPYSSGTADVWYSDVGVDCWVEYKFLPKLPVRVPVDPTKELSALQKQWLNDRYDEGRNVAVIIGWKDGRHTKGVLLRDKAWEHPIPVDVFKNQSVTKEELADAIANNLEKPCH